MLGEYATELASIVNGLTNHMYRLRAWYEIISELVSDDRLAVSHDFLDTLSTLALVQPSAVKSRFDFASGHLCHQANRLGNRSWTTFPKRTSTSTIST